MKKSSVRLTLAILAVALLQLQGCVAMSVVAPENSAPIPKISAGGLKIIYMSTEMTAAPRTGLFGQSSPAFGGAYGGSFQEFNGPTSRMFAAFYNIVGPGIQSKTLKVESIITAFSELRSGNAPMQFSEASKLWPTLIVAPKRVVRSCQGGSCMLRYTLSLQLFSGETKTTIWNEDIEQSALVRVGENAPSQSYSNFAEGIAGYLSGKFNN
jgi:hypothetical protein